LLISDIHVAGPDMSPQRLSRTVRQVNAQKPDAVLIAGDVVSDKQLASKRYSLAEAIAPLRDLKSRFGTFAVLGNHDHWRNAAATHSALRRFGIKVLDNSAARAGPLVIGGLDDAFTKHDDLGATLHAMADLGGEPILLSHSPDPFPRVPAGVKLMLAGHTHCGQIRLPLVGAISYMSDYGDKYACGVVIETGKTLIVGAGLGTSILPLRLGAVPDMWVITLKRRSR
jgi:predicted MPP superfamily phosphohydrolase